MTDISVCCHYLAKIRVWKWVEPLISNFLQRGCGELFTSSFFYMSAKYYLWYSDCYQLLMMSHLAFYILSPRFQLQETLHGSERQRDVKKHVLWLITPQTCWEHRHYVMPDRAPLHQDINSSLCQNYQMNRKIAVPQFLSQEGCQQSRKGHLGKTNSWPTERWCNRQGALARTGWIILKTYHIC